MLSILFDYGGTLDSDGQTWLERFLPIYKEAGIIVPRPRFERAFYDSDDHLPTRFDLQGLSLEQTLLLQVNCILETLAPERAAAAPAITARFVADCRQAFRRNRPVLERLRRDHRLGVVSNFYGNLDSVLESEGLRGLFSVVVDSGVAGVLKPDPAIFQQALAALDSSPAETVMVGDSVPRDMRGAEGLGLRHIQIGALSRPACCPQALRAARLADIESVLPAAPLRAAPLRAAPIGDGKTEPDRHDAPLRVGIIAAGDGTRLQNSHPGTIKPLVPVRGRPLCHWVISALKEAGLEDFTILFNSRGRRAQESLLAAFPDIHWTFLERDTASSWESFRLVAKTLAGSGQDFIISTIDAIIPPAEVRRFAQEARRSGAACALALTRFVDDEKPLWADLRKDGMLSALGEDARVREHVTCGLYYLNA
ncbi:MAG: HAD-IA family hydrolase, partial [Elusimicrobiota bacterium]